MRDWDAVYIDHAPRPVITWRPDETGALVGYVIDGDVVVRADTAPGRFSNYEPAPSPQERIRRWLAHLDVHAEDRTGTAAQLKVELITGRQFRARLADVIQSIMSIAKLILAALPLALLIAVGVLVSELLRPDATRWVAPATAWLDEGRGGCQTAGNDRHGWLDG